LRKEAFPQGESEQAIASGSLLYCHFEEEAWSEAMHHYMLEAGDNAAVDGWWTDFGGAPGGVPVPVRKPFSFFGGVNTQTPNIRHDRLGTNMGRVEKRGRFCRGSTVMPSGSARTTPTPSVRQNRVLSSTFYIQNDHVAKPGSGQT
jgi:hypothetical protein